jgi:ribokinase
MKIYNIGSANVDYVYQVPHFVRPGETLSAASMQVFPGGKGLNQSVALGKAGAQVIHSSLVGEADSWLIEMLRDAKVDTTYTKAISGPSGHAIIQVDEKGQNCILLFAGANHCFTAELFAQVLENAEAGDILLVQNEINGLSELFEIAHAKGLQIALNPSPFAESLRALPLQYVTYWILNETEGKGFTGLDKPEEILEALYSRYPDSNVILTLGKDGAYFRNGKEQLYVPAMTVKAVDTTAAGDTFTGYFLAMIAKGSSVESAMQTATKASAITVSREGAAVSIPWNDEVM